MAVESIIQVSGQIETMDKPNLSSWEDTRDKWEAEDEVVSMTVSSWIGPRALFQFEEQCSECLAKFKKPFFI